MKVTGHFSNGDPSRSSCVLATVSRYKPHWPIISAILATMAGVLCFRHFISLDGPMHLLHASQTWEAWQGVVRSVEGVYPEVGKPHLGDLLLIPLVRLLPVFMAHKVFAVFSLLIVYTGALCLSLAYGSRVGPGWLLILPVAFGFPLLLGLFHFVITCGLVLWCSAWWIRRNELRWRDLLFLGTCIAICQFGHRMGGALLVGVVGMHELTGSLIKPSVSAQRWSFMPKWIRWITVAAVVIGSTLMIHGSDLKTEVLSPDAHDPILEFVRMRSLLLLDSVAEIPFLVGSGLLFLFGIVLAIWGRWRSMRSIQPSDALLLLAMALVIVSIGFRTPKTELLYLAERTQWLALLLLAIWLGLQPMPRRMAWVLGIGIIGLHATRMLYIERRMAICEQHDRSMLDAARHFSRNSFAVPVGFDEDWLSRHRTAYTAIAHSGIVFSSRDHVLWGGISYPYWAQSGFQFHAENDWNWMTAHIQSGRSPHIAQVLVMGTWPEENDASRVNLSSTLHEYFTRTFHDGYVEVWTAK